MIRSTICILNLFICFISNGQMRGDYNWQLGLDSSPTGNPYPSSIELNFNNNKITIDTFYRSMSMLDFNTSLSDSEGQLLLYSNGCQIRDGGHKYILGSNNLNPGSVNDEWCLQNRIGYPIFEGGILLPFFNDSIVILLHQHLTIESSPLNIFVDGLFNTTVVRNGSTYELVKKAEPIISNNSLTDGNIEAVKGIGNDIWWVIQGKSESNVYYKILLDSAHVDTILSQSIGEVTLEKGEASGQSAFSTDGTMYARYTPSDDLFLFDFDRSSGLLSNFRKFHVSDSAILGGLAFSSNNRYLYVAAYLDLYQFDLWADNIEDSKVHIAHFDGYADPFPATFFHMQLGPDCRIYVFPPNGIKVMHVINYPDLPGLECGFVQHGFHFPVANSITIPNFPSFRLDLAPPCDPNIVSGFWEYHVEYTPVSIYPNPTTGVLTLKLGEQWLDKGQVDISIVDQYGRVCLTDHFAARDRIRTLSLTDLAGGIYFLSVQSAKRWYSTKISKI
ncbi:MAG: T9SS type A sorting domain-containing protein [Saprospiraceae bacterium]